VILEFKVYDARKGERTLEDTAQNALKQIEEKIWHRAVVPGNSA